MRGAQMQSAVDVNEDHWRQRYYRTSSLWEAAFLALNGFGIHGARWEQEVAKQPIHHWYFERSEDLDIALAAYNARQGLVEPFAMSEKVRELRDGLYASKQTFLGASAMRPRRL